MSDASKQKQQSTRQLDFLLSDVSCLLYTVFEIRDVAATRSEILPRLLEMIIMKTNVPAAPLAVESKPLATAPLSRRSFLGSGLALAGAAGTGLLTPAEAGATNAPAATTGRRIVLV